MLVRLKIALLITFLIVGKTVLAQTDEIELLLDQSEMIYSANPDSSFVLCERAEELAKESGIHQYDGSIAYGKGRYLLLKTKYGEASNEFSKAILAFESEDDAVGLAGVYSLQSILYERLGDSDAAHNILLKSYECIKQSGMPSSIATTLSNLVLDYLNPEKIDSALLYLNELKDLKDDISNESLYYYHQNWGTYYYLIENYHQAIVEYQNAYKVANIFDMLDSRATITMMLSKAYLGNDQIDESIKYGELSLEISKNGGLIWEESEALEQLVDLYEFTGEIKKAFNALKNLSELEKEILNLEKVNQVNEIEGQLELTKREKIIAEKDLAIQKEKLESSNARSKNTLLYLILTSVLIITLFVVWVYIKTKKLNISISKQKALVEEKSEILEEAYNHIHDSLEYSKFIQRAMLPGSDVFQQFTNDFFVLYQPKDIVSGDFYWAVEADGIYYFAVADCTGHGVPGAMVSIIGYNGLNRFVKELGMKEPSAILENLSDFVEDSLHSEERSMKDGMDIALCVFDPRTKLLKYAGANNAMYLLRNEELVEHKPVKRPVGKFPSKEAFVQQDIVLEKDDVVYLFSDGFADQFGGEKGKKLKYKAFKHLLKKHAADGLAHQKEVLEKYFDEWKGEFEQVDDVCIIGVRI